MSLTKSNHSSSLSIKQLKGSLVESIRHTEQALKGMELSKGDESILAGVENAAQERDGGWVEVGFSVESKVIPHKVLCSHVLLPMLFNGGIL